MHAGRAGAGASARAMARARGNELSSTRDRAKARVTAGTRTRVRRRRTRNGTIGVPSLALPVLPSLSNRCVLCGMNRTVTINQKCELVQGK